MPDSCGQPPASAGEPERVTVFLVDADDAVRDAVASALRAAGFRTRAFAAAQPFLSAYIPGQPACLVVDLDLPDTGGIALLQALEAAGHALPAILTSRRLRRRPITGARSPMPALLLEKPFGIDDLLPLIRRALGLLAGAVDGRPE
jgi:FixJ family two-component response regulator